MEHLPAAKRRKLDSHDSTDTIENTEGLLVNDPAKESSGSRSLERTITPPALKRAQPQASNQEPPAVSKTGWEQDGSHPGISRYLSSPIQLMCIRDLPASHNVDTIGLYDILGDPLIRECWQFNYLFDLDFLMGALDPDVRGLMNVKIVHGSWKKEDSRRIMLEESAKRHPNVQLITAHMPEPFGTHHSKMMILIRHDDSAQVIIHTANMISRDWTNMSQAIWRSPLLPLRQFPAHEDRISNQETPIPKSELDRQNNEETAGLPVGSGRRFKIDLLRYLQAYGNRLRELTRQLLAYDFSAVRAALIASTPSRIRAADAKPIMQTSWGYPGLKEILGRIPISSSHDHESPPSIIAQISSVATLGQKPDWLNEFKKILSHSLAGNIHGANSSNAQRMAEHAEPTLNIIFPTPVEIRNSLDGYVSGGSIHMKLQSAAQQKQLTYLKPLLCRWWKDPSPPYYVQAASDTEGPAQPSTAASSSETKEALRSPAAPHIKTYIRFSDASKAKIDWAMVTSANLSTQAWGSLRSQKDGEVRISSYEIGVVVWPSLFKEANSEVVTMVPTFGKDMPEQTEDGGNASNGNETVVGFRMPYDLPLAPYGDEDVPWCATANYEEPDWTGGLWKGW